MSVRGGGGSNGSRQQQLLGLQEASPDSEYVLLLPTSLAGVLLEVLERALQCITSGNNGCVRMKRYGHCQAKHAICLCVCEGWPDDAVIAAARSGSRSLSTCLCVGS